MLSLGVSDFLRWDDVRGVQFPKSVGGGLLGGGQTPNVSACADKWLILLGKLGGSDAPPLMMGPTRMSAILQGAGSITWRPPMKLRSASGITIDPSFCW